MFASPFYPKYYQTNAFIKWQIIPSTITTSVFQVSIHFALIDLGGTDSVAIYDGQNQTTLIEKYVGVLHWYRSVLIIM